MSSISRLIPRSTPGIMPDSLVGRILTGIAKFSSEQGSKGQDRLKGTLDGLARAAVEHSPAITQAHERQAVLHHFEEAYRQFYSPAGLKQLLKSERLDAYTKLHAAFATADDAHLERQAGAGGAIR